MARHFQDLAGTIPARAVGDPVALVRRAAGSSDATQPNPMSRPVVGRTSSGVWYLEGGSLLLSLPDGDYGLAYVDHLGRVTITTVEIDGVAPVEMRRAGRQVEIILRKGAFADDEAARITAGWAKYGEPSPSGFLAITTPSGARWVTPEGETYIMEK